MKDELKDTLRKHNKVSFCCYSKGERRDGYWAYHVKSVIVFGRISFVEDKEKIEEIARKLSYKFTDDEAYIQHELNESLHRTLLLELHPEHITGKYIVEA